MWLAVGPGRGRAASRVAALAGGADGVGKPAAEQDALPERAGFASADCSARWPSCSTHVEARMVQIPGELYLTHLVITIPGISAASAAPILAETGDPGRYHDPLAGVRHAGLAPRANESGIFPGAARTTGRAGPGCAPLPGARSGVRCRTTPSTSAGTPTSPAAGHIKLNDGKARSALVSALLRGCSPSLPRGCRGIR